MIIFQLIVREVKNARHLVVRNANEHKGNMSSNSNSQSPTDGKSKNLGGARRHEKILFLYILNVNQIQYDYNYIV